MGVTDEILERVGLKFDELTVAERNTLLEWSQVLDNNQLDIGTAQQFITSLKSSVQNELEKTIRETPGSSWVSIVALFIPFYGLIRKWYQDENRLYLEARLRNLTLLEAFFTSPKKAREALDRAIAGIVSNRAS